MSKSVTVVGSVTPQDAEGVRVESADDTTGRPSTNCEKTSLWIKHTLPSGLVIEVEATGSRSLVPPPTRTTNQVAPHGATRSLVRARSPEPPHDHDSFSDYDISAEFSYTHIEDWLHQGGDIFFEQYRQGLTAQYELPFHEGYLWQRTFIPTLLQFLGTQNDPWEWSGDAVLPLLPAIWLTVYGDSVWPDEYDALVRSLATDSVLAWFESFASNALVSVEDFLKSSTDGAHSLSKWSEICEEMMQDGGMFHERPDGVRAPELFSSVFIVAPLSDHSRAIRGGVRIEGLENSYDDLERPFGAIGLAAAAAFRAILLFRVRLVGYDEDGKLFVKSPTSHDDEPPTIDTSFSEHTAGSTTRQYASLASHMVTNEIDPILLRAHNLALDEDQDQDQDQNDKGEDEDDEGEETFNPNDEILNSFDDNPNLSVEE